LYSSKVAALYKPRNNDTSTALELLWAAMRTITPPIANVGGVETQAGVILMATAHLRVWLMVSIGLDRVRRHLRALLTQMRVARSVVRMYFSTAHPTTDAFSSTRLAHLGRNTHALILAEAVSEWELFILPQQLALGLPLSEGHPGTGNQ
jgi:hypothetical protein